MQNRIAGLVQWIQSCKSLLEWEPRITKGWAQVQDYTKPCSKRQLTINARIPTRSCSLCCSPLAFRHHQVSRNVASLKMLQHRISRHAASFKSDVVGEKKREEWMFSSEFKPDIDLDHLSQNAEAIAESVSHRKGNIDVNDVLEKMHHFQQLQNAVHDLENGIRSCKENLQATHNLETSLRRLQSELDEAENEFYQIAVALPNTTHPDVPTAEDALPVLVEEVNEKQSFDFPMKGHVDLGENLDIFRAKNLGHITGHRSYFLKGAGAMLEDALIRFTLDRLVKQHGFTVLKVPDIVKPLVFEGCGMRTEGLHTQVYRVSPQHHANDFCLAGTAEVGIAGYFMNRTLLEEDLPMRVCAASRCYRAETAHSAEARGLYRVHQFSKVEMFCVAPNETGEEGEAIFEEFVGIQRNMFKDLGLHFKVLDMPAHDLGAPAYRKFDMEAWMPHRNAYGEISSTSNCTDFQSRRLNIKYTPTNGGPPKYVHTLNGTACAVPRMTIAILETFQQRDGSISVPDALQPFMDGMKEITKPASGRLHFTRL